MADPLNFSVIDQVVRTTGLEVEPAICSDREIEQAIDHYYGTSSTMDEVIQVLDDGARDEDEEHLDTSTLAQMAGDAPIVKLVNLMLSQGVKDRASDIHVEPEEKNLLVRFRVDGVLREAYTQPKKLQNAIVSRLKIMASMDIAERRIPQDGRIQMKIEGKPIDMRFTVKMSCSGFSINPT
jgi:type IV pilus assembly protein PilB